MKSCGKPYKFKYRHLSPELERELLIRAKQGDVVARNELVEFAMPYILKFIKDGRFTSKDHMSGLIDELIQVGAIAAIHSIERYDLSQHVRFSTYSRFWVKALLQRFVHDNRSVVVLKSRLKYLSHDVGLEDDIVATTFDENSDDQFTPYEALTRLDLLQYDDQPTPEECYAAKEQIQILRIVVEAIDSIVDPVDSLILTERLMRDEDDEATLRDISAVSDLTHEAIRLRERRIIRHLRKILIDNVDNPTVVLDHDSQQVWPAPPLTHGR